MAFIDLNRLIKKNFTFKQVSYLKCFAVLASITILSQAISVLWTWILSSYFKVDVPGTLMFRGDDGWCVPGIEGLGNHCFGDFNERFNPNSTPFSVAYPNNLELSPIGPYLTYFANFFADLSNPKIILLFFYFLSILLVLLPLVMCTQSYPLFLKIVIVSIFGIST